MARIRVIGPAEATGALSQAYQDMRERMHLGRSIPGMPKAPNIMKIFSLRPEYLQAASSQFHTMWGGDLPRTLKEMIAVTVSKATNCHY